MDLAKHVRRGPSIRRRAPDFEDFEDSDKEEDSSYSIMTSREDMPTQRVSDTIAETHRDRPTLGQDSIERTGSTKSTKR